MRDTKEGGEERQERKAQHEVPHIQLCVKLHRKQRNFVIVTFDQAKAKTALPALCCHPCVKKEYEHRGGMLRSKDVQIQKKMG